MTDPRTHADYADWDAAYVLGALSSTDRRAYEAHLETCDRCRLAVADLTGLPGLLGRVDADRAFSLLEEDLPEGIGAPPPPADLVARIERAERGRRRRRAGIIASIAAAVLVIAGVTVPVTIAAQQPHPTVAVALSSSSVPLTAQVALTDVKWGTRIDMHCAYTEAAGDDDTEWDYALWVVDKEGEASQVSTWKAKTGSQVKLTAATDLTVAQIASVQVRSASTGDVLLSKKL
jgi:anti-sigma-K factor RskA